MTKTSDWKNRNVFFSEGNSDKNMIDFWIRRTIEISYVFIYRKTFIYSLFALKRYSRKKFFKLKLVGN
jgi:hypothetical protein